MPGLRERVVGIIPIVGESIPLQATLLSLMVTAPVLIPIQDLGIETCWWHYFFGFHCPSCGLTRSFIALAHGRIAASFGYHWIGPPLFVCVVLAWADRIYRMTLHRPLFTYLDTGRPLRIICWVLLGSWAIRLLLVGAA